MSYENQFIKKYAGNDPQILKMREALQAVDELKQEARLKNYKPEFIFDVVDELKNRLKDEHEQHRRESLSALKQTGAEIEATYRKKMLESDEAQKRVNRYKDTYAALSDSEVRQRGELFKQGKVDDVNEIQILSAHLRERGIDSFDSFRAHFNDNGYDKPHERLAPEVFRDVRELEGLRYGQFQEVLEGKGLDGTMKRVPRTLSIDNIFDENEV